MNEKLKLISEIFSKPLVEVERPDMESPLLQHGKYYGGVYNGKKWMYSSQLIEKLSIERLEAFIKKQISYV